MDDRLDFDVKNKKVLTEKVIIMNEENIQMLQQKSNSALGLWAHFIRSAKKGRRAGLGFFTLNTKDSGNQDENNGKDYLSPRLTERKSGGWADETLKPNGEPSKNVVKDFDDGVPVIPNLEDNADEELIGKIAKAPLIGVNKVASYKELENDLLKHTAFASLEELNLRILTDHLYPEPALSEPDEPWTKELLLSEIISVMNNEREKEMSQGLSYKLFYAMPSRNRVNILTCDKAFTETLPKAFYFLKNQV